MTGGRKNVIWKILRDGLGEDFFSQINILQASLGNLFVTVTSIMAENNFSRFPEEDLREGSGA